jgi:hypothetical protein
MLTWQELAELPEAVLSRHDIAAVNLACAADLPGAERIDPPGCLETFDRWAAAVRQKTALATPAFSANSARWDDSLGIFQIHCLVSVLQMDFGVHYSTDRIADPDRMSLEDTFVHGVAQGLGGTCASLPVVYAAVGRRLGYPLRLVSVAADRWGHRFLRWDDKHGTRFNIEINNNGFDTPPDDYYCRGVYSPTLELLPCTRFLRSKNARQELAGFLADRSCHCLAGANREAAANCFAHASHLDPEDHLHRLSLEATRAQRTTCSAASAPSPRPDQPRGGAKKPDCA